jgi:hypothetical protein
MKVDVQGRVAKYTKQNERDQSHNRVTLFICNNHKNSEALLSILRGVGPNATQLSENSQN